MGELSQLAPLLVDFYASKNIDKNRDEDDNPFST
jgi:hypothetical protein